MKRVTPAVIALAAAVALSLSAPTATQASTVKPAPTPTVTSKYFDEMGPMAHSDIQVVDQQPAGATVGTRFSMVDVKKTDRGSTEYPSTLRLEIYSTRCTYHGRSCLIVRSFKQYHAPDYIFFYTGKTLRGVKINLYGIDGTSRSDYNVRQQRLCRAIFAGVGGGVGRSHGRLFGTSCANRYQLRAGYVVTSFDFAVIADLYPYSGGGGGSW